MHDGDSLGGVGERGALLLEEPELSLHPGIVQALLQMLACVQRKTGKQIFLCTHSPELLQDEGISLDETPLLFPGTEGTEAIPAAALYDIRLLLEGGLSLADAVIPMMRPQDAGQLALFADDRVALAYNRSC